MADFRRVFSQQIHAFKSDEFLVGLSQTVPVFEALRQNYKFRDMGVEDGEVLFSGGVAAFDDAAVFVERLALSDRRLVILIEGDSAACTAVAEGLIRDLAAATQSKEVTPYLMSHQTSSVVGLGFSWRSLLAGPLADLALNRLPVELEPLGNASVLNMSLTLRLGFHQIPEELNEVGIPLSVRELTIEPRSGHPLADQIFWVVTPTDSVIHRSLVEDLEKQLSERSSVKTRPGLGRSTNNNKEEEEDAMSKGRDRTVYQGQDGKWRNKRNDAERASDVHDTQKAAQDSAREMLKKQGGGELTTKGVDGKIRDKDTVAPGNDPRSSKG